MNRDPPAIQVVELTHTYPGGITALQQLRFEVAKGESIGLVGPNGVGKTTLFLCLPVPEGFNVTRKAISAGRGSRSKHVARSARIHARHVWTALSESVTTRDGSCAKAVRGGRKRLIRKNATAA